MKSIKSLAKRIRESDTWNQEDLKELCKEAGLLEEWEASDGETFETVVYKAADILGVEII